MTDIDGSGFTQFDRVLQLVGQTRRILDTVAGVGELPEGAATFLEETTLPHLEGIQAGFHGWLRSDAAGEDELQYLLRQLATLRVLPPASDAERRAAVAEEVAERRLAETRPEPVRLAEAEPWHMAALAHARVVLAFIPRVPDEDVRFPSGRPTYSDIPTPRGPAELAGRIAELERQLWKAVTGRSAPSRDPAFRRTYGFFDAADRLGFRAFRGAA